MIKYRVKYRKVKSSKWLGHLEVTDLIRAALRRAKFPLTYSEGFHPLPRVQMGDALAVGVQSEVEYFDVCLSEECDVERFTKMNQHLPLGLEIVDSNKLENDKYPIQGCFDVETYLVEFAAERDLAVKHFLGRMEDKGGYEITISSKKGERSFNLKEYIRSVKREDETYLRIEVSIKTPKLKIFDLVKAIGLIEPENDYTDVVKVDYRCLVAKKNSC